MRNTFVSFESDFSPYHAEIQTRYEEVKDSILLVAEKATFNERKLQVVERGRAESHRRSGSRFRQYMRKVSEEELAWRKQVDIQRSSRPPLSPYQEAALTLLSV